MLNSKNLNSKKNRINFVTKEENTVRIVTKIFLLSILGLLIRYQAYAEEVFCPSTVDQEGFIALSSEGLEFKGQSPLQCDLSAFSLHSAKIAPNNNLFCKYTDNSNNSFFLWANPSEYFKECTVKDDHFECIRKI